MEFKRIELLLELIALQQEIYSQRKFHNPFNNCKNCEEIKKRIKEIRKKLGRKELGFESE